MDKKIFLTTQLQEETGILWAGNMSELLEADQSYQTLPSMLYHMETRTSTEGHS